MKRKESSAPYPSSEWNLIPCTMTELHLRATLDGGQSFRWKKCESTEENEPHHWLGTMANCVWALSQTDTHIRYKILGELPYPSAADSIVRMKIPKPKSAANKKSQLLYDRQYYEDLLRSYFRLDIPLAQHYAEWSAAHSHFRKGSECVPAVRVLNQEPVENLFSFICSQNNHIGRISSLVEKLCELYGPLICRHENVDYHAFPDCVSLAGTAVEQQLRDAKFGYRAKFIQRSAAQIVDNGDLDWFGRLQKLDYALAHAELLTLTGIGPKVADCICLMSLGHLQAIPVDTHVFKIAVQHYLPKLAAVKSVTPKVYAEIGDCFRTVYGPMAGWAQTVLFCADLAKFQTNEKCDDNKKSRKC